jgi:hypothetical protein
MGFADVMALITVTIVGCIYVNFQMDMGWDQVTLKHAAESHYSKVSSLQFGILRLVIAAIIWTSVHWLYVKGLDFHIIKRRKPIEISLRGGETFTMFTVWSWIMQVLDCFFHI